jgi:hypothetical protein
MVGKDIALNDNIIEAWDLVVQFPQNESLTTSTPAVR